MEASRYQRQTMLPEFGSRGQERLAKASLLIAGAGGLGSASALYLCAAGIGKIVIADSDRLEISNLNRQVIHDETALGVNKAVSAKKRMTALNSTIEVAAIQDRLTPETLPKILKKVDLVIDATDNYTTRQWINRESLNQNKPWIFGGVQGFDGMASIFIPQKTPCFECIVKPSAKPEQGAKGIIGPTAGIIGSFQAMAAIKYLLGHKTGLENRLLRLSGKDMRIHFVHVRSDPDCPACSSGLKKGNQT